MMSGRLLLLLLKVVVLLVPEGRRRLLLLLEYELLMIAVVVAIVGVPVVVVVAGAIHGELSMSLRGIRLTVGVRSMRMNGTLQYPVGFRASRAMTPRTAVVHQAEFAAGGAALAKIGVV